MNAATVAQRTDRRSSVVSAPNNGPQPTLRLTRRGRAVFGSLATALVAGALVLIASFVAPGAVASAESGAQTFPYVVAQPGDSLWSIASELDPGADAREVMSEIVRLNQLPSSELQVGDEIAVPLRFADHPLADAGEGEAEGSRTA